MWFRYRLHGEQVLLWVFKEQLWDAVCRRDQWKITQRIGFDPDPGRITEPVGLNPQLWQCLLEHQAAPVLMLEQNGLVGDAAAQRAKSRDFIFPDSLAFTQVSQQISRIFDIDDQGCFGGERGESKDGSVVAPREKQSQRSAADYRTLPQGKVGSYPEGI